MAKSKKKNGPGTSRLNRATIRRRLVALDEQLLALVPVDHSTILVTPEVVIHSNFQTRPPIAEGTIEEIDSVLVGRFQYGPAHFRALTALVIRQFLLFEVAQGKSIQDSAAFLKTKIDDGIARVQKQTKEEQLLGEDADS